MRDREASSLCLPLLARKTQRVHVSHTINLTPLADCRLSDIGSSTVGDFPRQEGGGGQLNRSSGRPDHVPDPCLRFPAQSLSYKESNVES